jgi:CheY-like chemotaxis protein
VTKVLYVEHNDDNLYTQKTRLELRGGFEVLAAEDSEKGCSLAASEHPDVILMDLEMPDDDRWEAVRRLKNNPQTRGHSNHRHVRACGGERAREGHRHRVRGVRCQTD